MADIIIDVSSYNGEVDWKKLKANGVKGGIAKIIRKDLNKDVQFDNNYKALHAQKMPWGVYNYSYATTVAKARSDMNLVCDILDKCDRTYFKYGVWFDIEDNVQAVLSKSKIAEIINAAQEVVESRGYIFGVYTGMSYYREHIHGAGVKCRNWWIARYYLGYTAMQLYQEPNTNYKPQLPENICAWQYTSSVEMPATGNGGRGDASILYHLPTKVGKTTKTTDTKVEKTSSVTADDIIKIMKSWIGLSRAKGTHKPIIDTYNAHKPLARNYKVSYTDEYCATTVSAAFIKANAVNLIGGTECSVERFINDVFKPNGIWIEDGTITPKKGYIICYNWNDSTQPNDGWADHIGVVESVSGNKITVIEGNMNGNVGRRTINVGWGNIRGYASPKYGVETKKNESTTKKNSTKKSKAHYNGTYPALPPRGYYQNGDGITTLKNYPTQIKRVQMLMNWAVNAKLAVDGKYGKATTAAVNKFKKKVGLKQDGCFNLSTLNAAKEFEK